MTSILAASAAEAVGSCSGVSPRRPHTRVRNTIEPVVVIVVIVVVIGNVRIFLRRGCECWFGHYMCSCVPCCVRVLLWVWGLQFMQKLEGGREEGGGKEEKGGRARRKVCVCLCIHVLETVCL